MSLLQVPFSGRHALRQAHRATPDLSCPFALEHRVGGRSELMGLDHGESVFEREQAADTHVKGHFYEHCIPHVIESCGPWERLFQLCYRPGEIALEEKALLYLVERVGIEISANADSDFPLRRAHRETGSVVIRNPSRSLCDREGGEKQIRLEESANFKLTFLSDSLAQRTEIFASAKIALANFLKRAHRLF